MKNEEVSVCCSRNGEKQWEGRVPLLLFGAKGIERI